MQVQFFLKRIFQISLLIIALLFFSSVLHAQTLTQTVRGTVIDKQVKSPLPGVVVQLLNADPPKGTSTDLNGNFKLTNIPVGRQSFRISFIGYQEIVLNDIDVSSGKEVVLNIELEEKVTENNAVVITADKKKPLNEMSAVSARTFSVEETQRFAAAVNDPARAALAYAGVTTVGDGNNFISIRGNAPNGLLWRMEGVEVPNPNHFSSPGTSGGGISILSAQLLTNSDFITGAFAAEYGNATSGVFDLRLRRGNNERREFTFQAGVLGIDAAAEGPFSAKHNGSYLINYRYSTLGLLGKAGILSDGGVTTFQDLSFNFVMPTEKSGTFTFFGFGGLSSEIYQAKKDSTKWEGEYDRYSSRFSANTGASGFTWSRAMNEHAFLKLAAVASSTDLSYNEHYLLADYNQRQTYYETYLQNKFTFSATVTNKFNSHHTIRSGIILNEQNYKVEKRYYDEGLAAMIQLFNAGGNTEVGQAFTQWQFRPTDRLTFNTGFHALLLALNKKASLEPRASASWEFLPGQSFSLGYGLHSQVLPLAAYLTETELQDGTFVQTNKNLDLLKAHHLVFAYDRGIGQNMRVKAEVYGQWLMNVPVSSDPHSSYAEINELRGDSRDSLVSKGKGRNYGIELTLEKFFSKGSYFIFSGSLYDSKYEALDGTWRNTRYNGQYSTTFTGGKEFTLSEKHKSRVIGMNIKLIYSGGFYDTPIDLYRSQQTGTAQYNEANAFTDKMPDYFRTDIGISLKRNFTKWTSKVSLDIQNVSNRKNVFNKYYDAETGTIKYNYQAPLIPVLSYRVQF